MSILSHSTIMIKQKSSLDQRDPFIVSIFTIMLKHFNLAEKPRFSNTSYHVRITLRGTCAHTADPLQEITDLKTLCGVVCGSGQLAS